MITVRRFVATLALVALLGPASLAGAPTAEAGTSIPRSASEAAEFCRELDEEGVLADLGATRGECVNFLRGAASENANNFIAGTCGIDFVQVITNTTTKGQCIKALRQQSQP